VCAYLEKETNLKKSYNSTTNCHYTDVEDIRLCFVPMTTIYMYRLNFELLL